ncbi:transposable element Tcb2 transposase [Trichonephila clavipes]|nr:transposable element Tcb2 transposase [Trichonephila clavipes]
MRVLKQWTNEHRTTRKTGSGRWKKHNARPHVAKMVRDFCSAQHMQILPWPAYSPYIPPIEHVWDLVDTRLARDPRLAASKDELLLRMQAI